MRDYAKISTSLWRSRKWRAIGDDARLLYLYLHTCPHVNSVGCFILPTGYALDDLGWERERYLKGIESLSRAYLIGFDDQEHMVRIVDYLRHDPFTNPKHADGAVKIALKLPECGQRDRLFEDLRGVKHVSQAVLPLADESLSKAYRKPIETPNPNPNPNPNPFPEPEPFIGGDGNAPTLREKILAVMGLDSSGVTPSGQFVGTTLDMAEVQLWLDLPGMTESTVLLVVRDCMARRSTPPSSFKYFRQVMQRTSGALTMEPLAPTSPSQAPDSTRKPVTVDMSKYDDQGNRIK